MENQSNSIAIVSSTQFKWTAQIQYMESLANEEEAVRYASEHHCNLIVKYSKRSGPPFDVMNDPNMNCATEASNEVVETVPIVSEPESISWSKIVLRKVFGLCKTQ